MRLEIKKERKDKQCIKVLVFHSRDVGGGDNIMHSGAFCELILMPSLMQCIYDDEISSFEMHKMFTMCILWLKSYIMPLAKKKR